MDGKRFDDLSRFLAASRSRRGVLGAFGATVAALAIGTPASGAPKGDKPSKCYGGGSRCTNGKQCCSGVWSNRVCEPELVYACSVATDCPGADTDCQVRTCNDGVCGVAVLASGTPLAAQTLEDCATRVCDGNGGVESVVDAADIPGDENECTEGACIDGIPVHLNLVAGTTCGKGGQTCDGAGQCIG